MVAGAGFEPTTFGL